MPDEQNDELTERQRFWLRHLRACEASGQTSIDYARAHGLKVKSLYSARKALAEKGALPPTGRSDADFDRHLEEKRKCRKSVGKRKKG